MYAASAAQRNLGRAAINAGADLVVGHHSHVVGGVEKYKGKYIVYGLGTLSSAIRTPDDMDAIFVPANPLRWTSKAAWSKAGRCS